MRLICLVLCALVAVPAANARSWFPPFRDGSCGFTRAAAYECIQHFGDTNKDGVISEAELEGAISSFVPWGLRWLVSVRQVMHDCDYDGNGVLTARDWMLSQRTCLPTAANLCTMQWFCERASEGER